MKNAPPYTRRSAFGWPLIAAIAATIAVATAALLLTERMPPRTIVMATGSMGTAYYAIGEQYARIFARHGVKLEVFATDGSVDNIRLLNQPGSGISVALVQSGTTNETESPGLTSLGTLFYEPLWLFVREQPKNPLQPLADRKSVV